MRVPVLICGQPSTAIDQIHTPLDPQCPLPVLAMPTMPPALEAIPPASVPTQVSPRSPCPRGALLTPPEASPSPL